MVLENEEITKNDDQHFEQWSPDGFSNGTWSNESTIATNASNGDIIRQPNAPQDLDLVSWPPNKKLPSIGGMDGYYFNVLNGIDKYVYVIDHGVDPGNPVGTPLVIHSFYY